MHSATVRLPRRRPLQILVVEDHADTLRSIRGILERRGHRVQCASGVQEALGVYSRAETRVLLSDITLSDGDGWELLERIPEAERPPLTVAMSINDCMEVRHKSLETGYHRFLGKPFRIAALLRAVEVFPAGSSEGGRGEAPA